MPSQFSEPQPSTPHHNTERTIGIAIGIITTIIIFVLSGCFYARNRRKATKTVQHLSLEASSNSAAPITAEMEARENFELEHPGSTCTHQKELCGDLGGRELRGKFGGRELRGNLGGRELRGDLGGVELHGDSWALRVSEIDSSIRRLS